MHPSQGFGEKPTHTNLFFSSKVKTKPHIHTKKHAAGFVYTYDGSQLHIRTTTATTANLTQTFIGHEHILVIVNLT